MNKPKLRLLYNQIAVRPITPPKQTKGGIILPDTSTHQKAHYGIVEYTGPGYKLADNVPAMEKSVVSAGQPMQVKVGDIVLLTVFSGHQTMINGVELLLMRENEVTAIVEGATEENIHEIIYGHSAVGADYDG